jgi:hypothetical protein
MVSFMATLFGAIPARAAPGLRNPALNISLAARKMVMLQVQKRKAEKAVSAWAAAQTVPRQKRSWLRKTPRAMKPAKKKRTFVASKARAAQGWEAGGISSQYGGPPEANVAGLHSPRGTNLVTTSRYMTERIDHSPAKIRKLICVGDAVRVSTLYQWATVSG